MPTETYRARWIGLDGEIVRDETFEYDVAAHEGAGFVRPDARLKLVIDAPYFKLREMQEHVKGYIETALVSPTILVIVNEDGHGLGLGPVANELVTLASLIYGQSLVGPLIFVRPEP
jgi:hypothetical protein